MPSHETSKALRHGSLGCTLFNWVTFQPVVDAVQIATMQVARRCVSFYFVWMNILVATRDGLQLRLLQEKRCMTNLTRGSAVSIFVSLSAFARYRYSVLIRHILGSSDANSGSICSKI